MKSVQLIRNKGYSLHPEEEALFSRLTSVERELEKPSVFRGRLNEILASVMNIKDANVQEKYEITNPDSLKPVFDVLETKVGTPGAAGWTWPPHRGNQTRQGCNSDNSSGISARLCMTVECRLMLLQYKRL